MKRACIAGTKGPLRALIDDLKGGSRVLIVGRRRPAAKLEAARGDHDERLLRLLRDGLVRSRRSELSRAFFSTQPPAIKGGVSAINILIEERRQGR